MPSQSTIPDTARIAEEAFVLGYPLVLMSRTMAWATAVDAPQPETLRAPVNTLVHHRDTPDTVRISGWLDLASGPLVLSLADTHGRYYVIWLRDAWGTVFAPVGARTTGTAPHAFALLGPGPHNAPLRPGLTPIVAPTRTVRLAGCVEAIGETDEQAGSRIAESFRLAAPARRRQVPVPACEPTSPVEHVERMDACGFFSEAERLARQDPPRPTALALLERLGELGAWRSPAAEARVSLERGVARGRAAVQAEADRLTGEASGRWRECTKSAGPLRRAGLACSGVDDDPAEDTLSARLAGDSDGQAFSGDRRYLLRFATDAPPPVHGFWSLAAYPRAPGHADATSDLRGLTLDRDGSLPIYLQHEPPARRRRANWLPVPAGGFTIRLDLHWPSAEALRRRWSPPPVVRVQ
jgi:hypothetical protein